MLVFDAHSQKYHNVTILTMSLLPFWALNVVVALLYMQGQKVLDSIKNILICVPKMNEGLMGLEWHGSE